MGKIKKGDHVLDIGCGAGVESILAANMTGETGKVVGVDIVPEMLARADEIKPGDEKTPVVFRKRTIPNIEDVVEKAYTLGCEKRQRSVKPYGASLLLAINGLRSI